MESKLGSPTPSARVDHEEVSRAERGDRGEGQGTTCVPQQVQSAGYFGGAEKEAKMEGWRWLEGCQMVGAKPTTWQAEGHGGGHMVGIF